jgi:hypothetical protein
MKGTMTAPARPGPGSWPRGCAVSEVIGSLILVSVVVISMAMIGTLLLSQGLPAKIPHFDAIIMNQSRNIYIQHTGGDPLAAGEFLILVDGQDLTSSFANNGDDPWSLGETLYASLPDVPGSLVFVLNQSGGGSLVVFAKSLQSVKKIPEPSDIEWYNFGPTGRCDWKYRKCITIDHTKVAGSLNDFPVLISLGSDAELAASAKDDGTSIVFTAADGTTKLSHEIESFTKASGRLVAWVKVTSVSSTEDTVLWMYYGNTGAADQQDVDHVWDGDFKGVWHLEESGSGAAGEYKDATANANNGHGGSGTASRVPTLSTGMMDGAQLFDGSNDLINTGSAASIDDVFGAGGTFSAWIYPHTIGGSSEGRIQDKSSGATGQNGWSFATYTNNVLMFRKGFGTTRGYWTTPAGSVTLNTWNHVAVMYDQGNVANNPAISINGISLPITEVSSPAGAVQSDGGNNMILGNRAGAGYPFDGIIDEVRASKTIRAPQWIQTEYTNQNDPAGFIVTGTEEEWWKC